MKKIFTISTIALFVASIILLLVSYGYHLSKAKEMDKNKQAVNTVNFGTAVSANCQKSNTTALVGGDVYLVDTLGNKKLFVSFQDLLADHANCAEYHNGNVYVIRRINYESYPDPNDDWTDELWKINGNKTEQKLFSARGLNFKVSPDESIIILGYGDGGNEIALMDASTKEIRNISKEELGATDGAGIQFEGWSDDSEKFWGQLYHTEKPTYFSISKQTGEISIYDSPHSFYEEHALNFNTGIVAYSEYPFLFDTETEKEYLESEANVNFYLYNLLTKEKKLIATSVVKKFEPTWIADNTVEYNNPEYEDRLTLRIK
ncbi:MAG: hypothetical protein COY66_06160 [Candidatus Kerfeldbacteria bacterium CG_4_10_14_0_8_um_filter_42_10]|uniref:Uncharacterized protein n=1 Tax=Candidatus Kerfeldbacteria bacterium CG_4_10_14_0_8_um_filter_42_10 TaxID=2014248 RepID=A0A2M7RG19_9BACT|nr:MAG: hypothetical protein COY66_06160 [Candidatus Kerfeldbacteria bacterium CG_4_10_14_0_8_um_filter_42_10]